jgi:hypothetical protein
MSRCEIPAISLVLGFNCGFSVSSVFGGMIGARPRCFDDAAIRRIPLIGRTSREVWFSEGEENT